jgi:D-beta-D-heptose 7-phosphate kinase/D-beta-D-heptose 1-phosphate adenosyltransferase
MKSTIEKITTIENLANLRQLYGDKKIALCSGCFDVFHSGHAVFFEQCKELCDILFVSVGSDSVIRSIKGEGRPVNFQNNRVFLVAAMGNVDYAISGCEAEDMKKGKIDFYEIIKNLKPNFFILNDDDSSIDDKRDLCNDLGVELIIVNRLVPKFLDNVSSTKIIGQIKNSIY